jgi:hypothetical protein
LHSIAVCDDLEVMDALLRFATKHWKRLLLAVFGTALASGSVAAVRRKAKTVVPLPELPVDAGPIVTEPSMAERLRNILPRRKPGDTSGDEANNKKKAGGGGAGAVNVPKPAPAQRSSRDAEHAPVKRTPIPPRPKSTEVEQEAQRAKDIARETGRRRGFDGPDFGIGRRRP